MTIVLTSSVRGFPYLSLKLNPLCFLVNFESKTKVVAKGNVNQFLNTEFDQDRILSDVFRARRLYKVVITLLQQTAMFWNVIRHTVENQGSLMETRSPKSIMVICLLALSDQSLCEVLLI